MAFDNANNTQVVARAPTNEYDFEPTPIFPHQVEEFTCSLLQEYM